MDDLRIVTIDCDYLEPDFAAAYLLIAGNGEAAFVDNNTAHSVPRLMEALRANNLAPESVRYVIITHVHLDHAGGTGRLMRECPRATLLAHPRAAPHMIDPSKLVDSARRVYGEETFARLYGEIERIPADRVRSVDDGGHVPFGAHALEFLHTRGHANHHFCILHRGGGAIFTGDAFGLAYPALQRGGRFILPSTSPTDFEPVEARKAVARIAASGAHRAYLTHFGAVTDLRGAAAQLDAHLAFSAALLDEATRSALDGADLAAFCERRLREYYAEYGAKHGVPRDEADWRLLKLDLELNGAGIAHVAAKRRAASAATAASKT